jgi:hypothetical protein
MITSKPARKRTYPESVEQRLFVQRWRLHPFTSKLPACAVPNGGRRSAREAAILKAEGVSAGVPDWLCFHPGMMPHGTPCVGLALEFKRPDKPARTTLEQREWHDHLRQCGWRVEIVRSAAEAWWVVEACYEPDLRPPQLPRPGLSR